MAAAKPLCLEATDMGCCDWKWSGFSDNSPCQRKGKTANFLVLKVKKQPVFSIWSTTEEKGNTRVVFLFFRQKTTSGFPIFDFPISPCKGSFTLVPCRPWRYGAAPAQSPRPLSQLPSGAERVEYFSLSVSFRQIMNVFIKKPCNKRDNAWRGSHCWEIMPDRFVSYRGRSPR